MKNMKLRLLVVMAACTLSMASWASTHGACKSGQKPNPKGSPACVAAGGKTVSKGTAKSTGKAAAKSTAKSRAKVTSKSRGKTKPGITSEPVVRTAPVAPPGNADCGSTQTLLQGGATQCPAPNGAANAAGAQSNPGSSCFAALAASNAARQLASRVPFLSDSAPGPDALANKAVPNKREKEELHSVLAGYDMCLDMAAGWRKQAYAPALVQALDAYWLQAKSILGELAAGKRNFGDAARAIADSDKAFRSQAGMPDSNVAPTAADHTPAPAR